MGDYPGAGTDASLASLLATIHGIYPQARVTSGYRGPNNPLTLRNPASMHAMGSPSDPRAVDVAPIPGVSFNDYVASVKKAGVPISQAFDEASHPFPWTTGPNWHLASGSAQPAPQHPYYNPQPGGPPPMPPQMPPQPMSLGGLAAPASQAQGPSLGALVNGLPQGNIPKPSKFTAGNVLGVLGDALSAYGGKQPTFGPFLREQQMMDKQQGFEREKFQQELQMRMYAMMHPEDMLKADIFNALPPTQQRAQLKYLDAVHPEYTMTAMGQVLNHRVTQPPPEAIARLQQDVGKGDHSAVVEFDQMFGPGAAAEALGGQ